MYARAGVGHLWHVDPNEQSLQVFARLEDKWLLLVVHGGDERVRAAPFDEVELDLARWWDHGETPIP